MINPALIPSESSLNAEGGEHDELEIFLETRLISSRVDQKLRTKEGRIHVFKEKIRLGIVGHWSGRGGALHG